MSLADSSAHSYPPPLLLHSADCAPRHARLLVLHSSALEQALARGQEAVDALRALIASVRRQNVGLSLLLDAERAPAELDALCVPVLDAYYRHRLVRCDTAMSEPRPGSASNGVVVLLHAVSSPLSQRDESALSAATGLARDSWLQYAFESDWRRTCARLAARFAELKRGGLLNASSALSFLGEREPACDSEQLDLAPLDLGVCGAKCVAFEPRRAPRRTLRELRETSTDPSPSQKAAPEPGSCQACEPLQEQQDTEKETQEADTGEASSSASPKKRKVCSRWTKRGRRFRLYLKAPSESQQSATCEGAPMTRARSRAEQGRRPSEWRSQGSFFRRFARPVRVLPLRAVCETRVGGARARVRVADEHTLESARERGLLKRTRYV